MFNKNHDGVLASDWDIYLENQGFYSGHFTLCICVGVSNFPSCDVNLFNIPRVNLSGIVWDFSYVAGSVCRCCVLWGVHLSFLPAIASSPFLPQVLRAFNGHPIEWNRKLHLNGVKVFSM